MLELIILSVVVLVLVTWYNNDAVSPKLLVQTSVESVGVVVGYAPKAAKATVLSVKKANLDAELHMHEIGKDAPRNFRVAKVAGFQVAKEHYGEYIAATEKEIAAGAIKLADFKK